MSYIFQETVISGICYKQTFLHAEKLYNISVKHKLYLVYVFQKKFFVVNNYVIYL